MHADGPTSVIWAGPGPPYGLIPADQRVPAVCVCMSASRMPSTSVVRGSHVGPRGVIPGHPNPLHAVPLP